MPGDEQEQSDDHAHDGDAAELAEAAPQILADRKRARLNSSPLEHGAVPSGAG